MGEEVVISSMSVKLYHEKSDPIRAAVDYATISSGSVSDNILASTLEGIHKKGKRMINLAKNDDFYAGLPDLELGIVEEPVFFDPKVVNPEGATPYPIVVLRENQRFIGGNDIDNPEKTDKYLSTKRIMRKMKIQIADLYRSLSGPEEDPNPDLGSLDDTFFAFSSDIYSTIESTAEYQWNFFDWVVRTNVDIPGSPQPPEDPVDYSGYVGWNEYLNTDNEFALYVTYKGIYRTTEQNVYLKDKDNRPIQYEKTVVPATNPPGDDPGEHSRVIIKKQTEFGVVEVISIVGLVHRVNISAKGDTKLVYTGIKEEFIGLAPENELAGTGAFYLPMIQEIAELANSKHTQIALFDGSMLILFAAETFQLKWYQSGWFKVLVTIVIIIITAWNAPAGIGLNSLVVATFQTLIVGFILELILAAVTDVFGAKFAAALAIIIAVKTGKFAVAGLPLAGELLKAVAVIAKTVQMEDTNDLQKEIDDFNESYKEKQEELNEQYALLSTTNGMTALDLVQALSNAYYNEAPDDFYNRTIHTSNPGVAALEAISVYIDNLLTLPEYDPHVLETLDEKVPLNENANAA